MMIVSNVVSGVASRVNNVQRCEPPTTQSPLYGLVRDLSETRYLIQNVRYIRITELEPKLVVYWYWCDYSY